MLNKLSFNIFNELNESESEAYKIKKRVLIESNGVRTINEEVKSFEEIIWDMELAEDYEGLRDAASYIADINLKNQVYDLIDTCENDGDDVQTCYSIVTSDLLDSRINDLNENKSVCEKCGKEPCECKTLSEDNNEKEERLASLKIQLEKDGDQLADDEKEAIEREIAELEKEVIKESSNPEADEKVGGDYNEFIEELQNFRQLMVDQVDVQSTKLASEIIMDTIEEYDDIIRNYERQKDIEIEGAMNESSLTEDYSEKLGGDPADFVSDVETIKAALEAIDVSGFGSHLAQQMVEDWIETCDRQIQKGKRLASGDEFYSEGCSKQKIEETSITEDERVHEAEEMQVKNLQVIKEQGNVYMLEDESKKMIVGENYNPDEGMIENAEVYENKDEADKDYLNRCDIKKNGEKLKSKNKNSDELNEGSLVETSYEYMSNKSGIPVEDLSKVVPKLIKKDKNFRDYATDYQIRIIKKELEKLKSKNK